MKLMQESSVYKAKFHRGLFYSSESDQRPFIPHPIQRVGGVSVAA
jgi:hypothetical protein